MRRLRIPNPVLQNNEKTYLDADYLSGTALVIVSSFTFSPQDIVVIGNPGEKITEGSVVSSLSAPLGFNINPALNFNHVKGTTIYRADWDTFDIEGQIGQQGWQVLKMLPIQWDKYQSIFVHVAGDDTWNYRFRLFNSVLGVYSEYSPTLSGQGFARNQVGQLILNTRKKIRDVNRRRFQDGDLIALFNDAQNDATSLLPKLWFLKVDTWETAVTTPLGQLTTQGNGLPTVAGVGKYSLAQWPDIDSLDKMKYYYTNGNQFLLWELESDADFDFDKWLYNQHRQQTDIIMSVKLLEKDGFSANGSFAVDPVPLTTGAGIFYPSYWKIPKQLVEITDATDFIFPQILEDYAAWRLHDFMGNDEDAKKYKDLYYGPSSQLPGEELTGLKLLEADNNVIRRANAVGRKLWNYRGRKNTGNYFGRGPVTHDFIKENYL